MISKDDLRDILTEELPIYKPLDEKTLNRLHDKIKGKDSYSTLLTEPRV